MSELEAFPVPGRHRLPDVPELPDLDDPAPPAPTHVRAVAVLDVTATLQAAPTALLLLDLDATVVAANAAAEELTGRTGADLTGVQLAALLPDVPAVELAAALDRALAGHRSSLGGRLAHPDGRDLPVVLALAAVPDDAGRPTHLVLHVDDRTEQNAREAHLLHRADHDPLTGLPHRARFVGELHQAVAAAHVSGTSTSVLVLDVAGIGEIDAVHGHAAGDRAVVELARRLRSAVRGSDVPALVGPATFAVLCHDTAAEQGALVAQRLGELTSGPVEALAATVELVTSVRVSSVHGSDDPGASFATLLTATGTGPGVSRGAGRP